VQYAVLAGAADRSRAGRVAFGRVAAELRGQGVRPPCVVSGYEAVRVAFRLGCASRQVGGHDGSIGAAGLQRAALTRPVVFLSVSGRVVPGYARPWRRVPLPDLPGAGALAAHIATSVTNTPAEGAFRAAYVNTPFEKPRRTVPRQGD
jgi:hypothetical protein